MTKDKIIQEIKRLLPIEQMELSILILIDIMELSGVASTEKVLIDELKFTLEKLRGK